VALIGGRGKEPVEYDHKRCHESCHPNGDRQGWAFTVKDLESVTYDVTAQANGTALRALTGNSNAGRDMLRHSASQVTEKPYEADMSDQVLKGMKLLEAKSHSK
jgi:hypothetical protein